MSVLAAYLVDRKAIPLGERARFSSAAQRLSNELREVGGGWDESVVVLETCERYEIYCLAGGAKVNMVLRRHAKQLPGLTIRGGIECVRHLFGVASGLHSRVLGEPHVLGQVRDALDRARQQHALHPLLADTFVYALRCGRLVRRRTALGVSSIPYAAGAVARCLEHFNALASTHVAVIGTGTLAVEVACGLRREGVGELTVVGRHEATVHDVATVLDARPLALRDLQQTPFCFDAIVAAVSAIDPVITATMVRRGRTRLLVDLGATPNVAPEVDAVPDVRVIRLEDFGADATSTAHVRCAERLVAQEATRYVVAREPVLRASHSCLRLAS